MGGQPFCVFCGWGTAVFEGCGRENSRFLVLWTGAQPYLRVMDGRGGFVAYCKGETEGYSCFRVFVVGRGGLRLPVRGNEGGTAVF